MWVSCGGENAINEIFVGFCRCWKEVDDRGGQSGSRMILWFPWMKVCGLLKGNGFDDGLMMNR